MQELFEREVGVKIFFNFLSGRWDLIEDVSVA